MCLIISNANNNSNNYNMLIVKYQGHDWQLAKKQHRKH